MPEKLFGPDDEKSEIEKDDVPGEVRDSLDKDPHKKRPKKRRERKRRNKHENEPKDVVSVEDTAPESIFPDEKEETRPGISTEEFIQQCEKYMLVGMTVDEDGVRTPHFKNATVAAMMCGNMTFIGSRKHDECYSSIAIEYSPDDGFYFLVHSRIWFSATIPVKQSPSIDSWFEEQR